MAKMGNSTIRHVTVASLRATVIMPIAGLPTREPCLEFRQRIACGEPGRSGASRMPEPLPAASHGKSIFQTFRALAGAKGLR